MADNLFRFSKTRIEGLPPAPPGGRDEYRDTLVPGLRLRVSPAGTKTYAVLARVKGGGLERVTIGSADKVPVEAAQRQAKQIIADLAQGRSHAAAARAQRGEMTVNELVADYLAATPMRPKSLHTFQGFHDRHIKPAIGKVKLSAVTPDRLRKLHTAISKETPTTANRCISLIKAAFNWNIDANGWTGENPARRVKKNPEESRQRYLLPAELARFFAALEGTEQPARDFFTLALLTGARKSNILAMRWADVNMDDAVWRIPAADAKAGESITVPLVPEAVEVLKGRSVTSPWVFPAESKTGHYEEPKRAWGTLCRRAELKDLRIHDLRRTMGSWLVRTGASTAINAKALGHKSMQAAAVYQRIADADPIREAMTRAADAMKGGKP
jgi:integrase